MMIKWNELIDKANGNQTGKTGTPANASNSDADAKVQTPGAGTDAAAKTNGVTAGILGGTLTPSQGTVGTNKKPYTYTTGANNQPYMAQLNSLYDQIMNRKPFQYDLNADLLYKQMADQYAQKGQMAMRDTMGTAAGLTGGYSNSYAQQVGNQAYQQYMTALNEQVPSLYQQALNAYLTEGDQLLQQYELAAAHPGYLEAIKPRTVTTAASSEKENAQQNAAASALLGSLLGGSSAAYGNTTGAVNTTATSPTGVTYNPERNPLEDLYYQHLRPYLK